MAVILTTHSVSVAAAATNTNDVDRGAGQAKQDVHVLHNYTDGVQDGRPSGRAGLALINVRNAFSVRAASHWALYSPL